MNKFMGFLFAILVTSCSTQKAVNDMSTTPEQLMGNWELITLDGKDITIDRPIVLNLDNNTVKGYAGCNQVNGSFHANEDMQISFDKLGTTRMMCEPENMQIESELLKALETANNYTTNGDLLSLNIGKRAPLASFRKVSDNKISGKYWKLIELDGQEVDMTDNQEREQFLTLRSDGSMYGFAGCNTFNGTYETKGGTQISFDPNMAVTMKSCPDIDVDETKFLEVFKTANNYTVSEDKLYLNVGKRMPLAVFEAVYF